MEPHGVETGEGRAHEREAEAPIDADWIERRALAYAARWESTRAGVTQLLERKIRAQCLRTETRPEPALALVGPVVERLVERDYVNDRRAATALCERLRRQGRSNARIRLRLRQKGVPEAIADELTRDDDVEADLSAAWKVARKRRLGPHCADPDRRAAERERHLAILARQGFSAEIAHRVVDARNAPEPGPDGTRIANEDRST